VITGILASAQLTAAVGGGGGGPFFASFTIPSGTVASNLTNFPVMVRLDDMPAGFWTHVKADGGDIRVKTTAAALVPMDLVRFDPDAEDGVLFFLAASVLAASDNEWEIHYGDPANDLLPNDDANGREAVWAAYEAVFTLGESGGDDRTGNGAMAQIHGDPDLFVRDPGETSPDIDSHQGVCWDGTHYYTVDTNDLYKWDASWNLVDSNTDPVGDAAIGGSPTVNHCGDPEVHDGRLYIPIDRYPNSGGLYNSHIAVFDPSDLSFIEAFDISAQAHEASSIAYCPVDGLLYITDYDGNNSTIYKYDPLDGSYEGTLTTDKAIPQRQGITWWRGFFWVSQDANDETLRVSYTGEVSTGNLSGGSGGVFGYTTTGNYEGIGHTNDALLQLIDAATPGPENVQTWRPRDDALCAGGGALAESATPFLKATGRSSLATYTLACSAAVASVGANRTAVSYWREAAGVTNTRQVIAYRHANLTLALWDVNNSWLDASPAIPPTLNQSYRMHAVYNGTTGRTFYVNGAQAATQAGITAVPSTLDTIRMFNEDDTLGEQWLGTLGFVYLYPGVLSAAWIAAEYENLNTPATFYTVGAETGA
jgi:hypothetical protein